MVSKFVLLFSGALLENAGGGRRADTGMPRIESEAIILRTFPLGEGDRLVSFLGRTTGRLRGVARGARRPKSSFGSTLEPLSHVRIWFFEKETRELVRIQQCELIKSFLDLHKDYSAGVRLALISEVTEAVLPEREPAEAAFRLILLTVGVMEQVGPSDLPLAYFNLWTVRLGGWLPSFERCARCGRDLGREGGAASGSVPGLFCPACRYPGMRTLTAGSLSLARRMLGENLEELATQDWPPGVAEEIDAYALDVIEHQIEKKLTTRKLLGALH